jgi:predicted RNA binding protein YcfA (HicA-like mRNA interferase family)
MRLHALERVLRHHGFALDHISGSHRVYNDRAGRRLVAALHPGRELRPGDVKAIRHDLAECQRCGQ